MEGLDMDELGMDDFLEEDFWFIINFHKIIFAQINTVSTDDFIFDEPKKLSI